MFLGAIGCRTHRPSRHWTSKRGADIRPWHPKERSVVEEHGYGKMRLSRSANKRSAQGAEAIGGAARNSAGSDSQWDCTHVVWPAPPPARYPSQNPVFVGRGRKKKKKKSHLKVDSSLNHFRFNHPSSAREWRKGLKKN